MINRKEILDLLSTIQKRIDLAKAVLDTKSDEEQLNCFEYSKLISLYSPQKKASLIEHFLISLLGANKNKAKDENGDFILNGENYELKVSFENIANSMNLRQIRAWQDIDYYLCVYIDIWDRDKCKCWLISKEQMTELLIGASATHGTKKVNENQVKVEYSLTIPLNKTFKFDQFENLDFERRIFDGET